MTMRISKAIKSLLAVCLFIVFNTGYSQEISQAFMLKQEKGQITYFDKKTPRIRSKISFSIEQTKEKDRLIYILTSQGQGDYDEYTNSSWKVTAEKPVISQSQVPSSSISCR